MVLMMQNGFTMGYWAVAFLDLLGQQDAFLETDYLPDQSDEAARERFNLAVANSVYVVTTFRELLTTVQRSMAHATNDSTSDQSPLRNLQPSDAERVLNATARHVRDLRWSDGIVLYTPLMEQPGHNPIMGLYELVVTTAMLTFVQLAKGNPIRGGLDIGTGTELESQLFGAGLVKAYKLESKVAKYPRIVVGRQLVEYSDAANKEPTTNFESRARVEMARFVRGLVTRDVDGQWIVDYVGERACDLYRSGTPDGLLSRDSLQMFAMVEKFAAESRQKWKTSKDDAAEKLFDRYSQLVRYLDSRAHLWRG